MSFAPLARLLVVVFGTLGLALHVRTIIPERLTRDEALFFLQTASIAQQLTFGVLIMIPVVFYGFCITTCFVRLQRSVLVGCSIAIAAIAIPVYMGPVHAIVARNALWTALCWSFVFVDQYYAKPRTVTSYLQRDDKSDQLG